ncbi:MAG: hypothetical protein ACM3Q1_11510, partial [Bacteroidales bacterium]
MLRSDALLAAAQTGTVPFLFELANDFLHPISPNEGKGKRLVLGTPAPSGGNPTLMVRAVQIPLLPAGFHLKRPHAHSRCVAICD